jgi:hypothetical protein
VENKDKLVLDHVKNLLEKKDASLMILGSDGPENIIMVKGSEKDLCRSIALGMAKDSHIKSIVKLAVEGYDFATEAAEDLASKKKSCKSDEKKVNNGPLDKCATCDIRHECPVVNDDVDPLKALIRLLGDMQERVHKNESKRAKKSE